MLPRDATIYVATAPVDMRLSFDRLAGLVREHLGADPRGGLLVVFHNRRRTHVKLLWHNRRGYALLYQRLDRGTYRIPMAIPPGTLRVQVTRRELMLLLRGMDQVLLKRARRRVRENLAE